MNTEDHYGKSELTFELKQQDPIFCHSLVHIPCQFVDQIYHQAALSQQHSFEVPGFKKGNVPIEYIKQNLHSHLTSHVKEFLFKYFVNNFLHKNICSHKIILGSEPRLVDIKVEPGKEALFLFECSLFNPPRMTEWKYFPFKPPKRKNYRDLDRQAELFSKEEREHAKQYKDIAIDTHDWVKFSLRVVDDQHANIFKDHAEYFWIQISGEEVDKSLHANFMGKTIGNSFFTNAKGLQDYFSEQFGTHYSFEVTIIDVLPNSYFCFDHFKRHFRAKTNKETLQKLIEVFSYRNDISQRRSMVEETFQLLFSKHPFTVPNYLILRQQEVLVDALKETPDYHVYRVQKDFKEQVHQLAERQCKENILIDQIAYHEKVNVSDNDIKGYLNLLQRPRMKEFIYFKPTATKLIGQEIPIAEEELKRICMREKTLNFIIYHLTRK